MKEFNLGDAVRVKFHKHAIGSKYDMREGVVVKKVKCMDEFAYGVNIVNARASVYKPFTTDVVGETSILDGLFEDNLELITE